LDTKSVLDHHLAALTSGDADGVLEDYTEESVLMTADGTVRGLDALRTTFDAFIAGLFAPGTYEFTMDQVDVCGEVAFIAWHATCADAEIRLGTDTFVVRDGKIVAQTFAAVIEPR
jgi:ketosteroid isomerase-like protein